MKQVFYWLLLVGFPVFSQPEFVAGERLFHQGQYDLSEKHLQAALQYHPSHTKTLSYLGEIAARKSDWDNSSKYFEKLKDLEPSAENHYRYGGALAMKAKNSNKLRALTLIPEIRLSFDRCLAIDPGHVNAHWALIELNLQLPTILGGSKKQAEAHAANLLKISPVDGWLAKGRIAEASENYKSAEMYYRKAIETGGSKTTYNKLSELYRKINQPEKAHATMAAYREKQKS